MGSCHRISKLSGGAGVLSGLAILAVGCWSAVPAAAAELPTSAEAVTAGAAPTLQTARAPVADPVSTASASADTAVGQGRAAAPALRPEEARAAEAVAASADAAKPVVDSAARGLTGSATAAPESSRGSGRPLAAASRVRTGQREPSSVRRRTHERSAGTVDAWSERSAGARPSRSSADAVAVSERPVAAPAAVRHDRDSGPDRRSSAGSSGAASGGPGSFYFGGLAMLAGALSLAGPALRGRLRRRPAAWWPAPFVSQLELPG